MSTYVYEKYLEEHSKLTAAAINWEIFFILFGSVKFRIYLY